MNKVGTILAGRYELLENIGSGGMADVYRAADRKLNRMVAVKILRHEYSNDESFIRRFQQEAMAAASIQTPYVVNIYDVGEEGQINYIIMELAEGITLKEYIQKKGRLEIVEAINIAMQIVTGIREAHLHGIIHRDIKPQNVMVTADGRAKVMDFGIARAVTAQTITANAVGSVHYISPEQARGSVCDERCDLYSIGITMYEMITGQVPFDGVSPVAVALAHIKEPITPPSTYEPMIPISLEKIIMKCTQKKPEQRYRNADELIDDLKKALMTPDEDFVKDVTLVSDGGTRVFSPEDTRKIKEEATKGSVAVKTQEEEDYQLGLEEEEEKESQEEEKESRMEKIVLAAGIGIVALILLIGIILFAPIVKSFFGGGTKNPEPVQTESESLQSDMEILPVVTGKSLEEAEKLLKEAGFHQYRVEQQASESIKEGYVISISESESQPLAKDAVFTVYVSSGEDTIPIPATIIGCDKDAAIKVLKALDFQVQIEEGFSNEIEINHVFRCVPGVDEEVKRGSLVTLYISAGVEKTLVPFVEGLTQDAAQKAIKNENLRSVIEESYDNTVEEGLVISQSIPYDTEVEIGTVITLVISKGPKEVKVSVPQLYHKTRSEAEVELENAGLHVGEIAEEHHDSIEAGHVISQSEEAGTEVAEGTSIDLVISLGPVQSVVPQIVGMSERDALQQLRSYGLLGECLDKEYSDAPEGEVIRMDHNDGDMVDPGTVIGYYVSAGPKPEEENENQ